MKPRFLLATFLAIPVITAIAVSVAGRVYWGHWFAPPASDDTVAALTSIQRFTKFSAIEPSLGESGPTVLMSEASNANDGLGENPAGRLPAALARRHLIPTSTEPVDPWLRDAVIGTLATGGLLEASDPGYPDPDQLSGYMATGTSAAGKPLVVAALFGQEASNDHHPYYEAVFSVTAPGALSLVQLRTYWFDVAGVEGYLLEWFIGIVVGVPLLILWGLMAAIRGVLISKRRRERSESRTSG